MIALLAGMLLLAACDDDNVAESTGLIELVSVHSDGSQGDDHSLRPSISADGRYVAFQSSASTLVAGDANGISDVFVRDTEAGTTTRVSVHSDGSEGDGGSDASEISADGRYVVFRSTATTLVAGDTNGFGDVFLHDRETGTTTRISVNSVGVEADSDNGSPSVSADGRYVAFGSAATNLVTGDTNGFNDIFVRDTLAGTTTRVSVADGGGAEATGGNSDRPSISGDGRFVAFESAATDLVTGDTNGFADIFVRDTGADTTTRVSVHNNGTEANNLSANAEISADGAHVAFVSLATGLVDGDSNGQVDAFVHSTAGSATARVSLNEDGFQGTGGGSFLPAISADGRYVAFESDAADLVASDTNGIRDIFVRDTVDSTTTRVSVDRNGAEATGGNSSTSAISEDGVFVAFRSAATDLVTDDVNGFTDLFRAPVQ